MASEDVGEVRKSVAVASFVADKLRMTTASSGKLLIVRLFGGLGNQLFIYAAARSLRLRLDRTLLLDDKSGFRGDPYSRQCRLTVLEDMPQSLGSEPFCRALHRAIRFSAIGGLTRWPVFPVSYCSDRDSAELLRTPPAFEKPIVYVDAYMQDERFFNCDEDGVREALTLPEQFRGEVDNYLGHSVGPYDVAVHMRMAWAPVGRTRRNIDADALLLDPEYYRAALGRLQEPGRPGRVFIFSDDVSRARQAMEWCRCSIIVKDILPQLDEWQELYMMSRFSRLVVSNSSFSWWGAFLGLGASKVVVCPRYEMFNQPLRPRSGWISI